jgi:hypothetical protein
MAFPQKRFVRIIGIYYPASQSPLCQQLYKKLQQTINEAIRLDWHIIIAGDFNAVPNSQLDKQSTTRKHHSCNPTNQCITLLQNNCLIDTYREINPYRRQFTWNRNTSASRLDQIWITTNPTWNIKDAYIDKDTRLSIFSDHVASICCIEAWQLQRPPIQKLHKTNTRYNWKDTTEEKWQLFSTAINQQLENYSTTESCHPDHLWNTFRQAVFRSAKQHIKKIKKHQRNTKSNPKNNTPHKIISIQKFLQQLNNVYNPINPTEPISIQASNTIKESLTNNEHIQALIHWTIGHTLDHKQIGEWIILCKDTIKKYKAVLKIITKYKQNQNIKNYILRRQTYLETNKRAMINSILEIPKRKINLDKIITHEPHIQIHTNPTDILQITKEHFHKWTSCRQTKNLTDFPNWIEKYQPKDNIESDWYTPLTTPFSVNEIKTIISTHQNHSAPGPNQIPYLVYKKLGNTTIQHICTLFNVILQTGITPKEWSQGTIYPIPKPKEWENNLNITRPITLLDTCRKIFTKAIANRLAQIFTKHHILSEHNWAALPGNSTQDPIHILQAIIEHAKENNQQAWILCQDMSKAYDSVHIKTLEKALKRIKIPEQITNILLLILNNRTNAVITCHGNTEEYKVEDGIDKGDTISPIL